MNKKYISLNNRYLPINNRLVLGNNKMYGAGFRKAGPVTELTQAVDGLLISDKNVMKGKGVTGVERRRPIRFIV